MSSQMQENGVRYPQSTEPSPFQHVPQSQGIYIKQSIKF